MAALARLNFADQKTYAYSLLPKPLHAPSVEDVEDDDDDDGDDALEATFAAVRLSFVVFLIFVVGKTVKHPSLRQPSRIYPAKPGGLFLKTLLMCRTLGTAAPFPKFTLRNSQ